MVWTFKSRGITGKESSIIVDSTMDIKRIRDLQGITCQVMGICCLTECISFFQKSGKIRGI